MTMNPEKWHLVNRHGTLLELRHASTLEEARKAQTSQNFVDPETRDWTIVRPGDPERRHVCWRVTWERNEGVIETVSHQSWRLAAERWIAETLRNRSPVRFVRIVRTVKEKRL